MDDGHAIYHIFTMWRVPNPQTTFISVWQGVSVTRLSVTERNLNSEISYQKVLERIAQVEPEGSFLN